MKKNPVKDIVEKRVNELVDEILSVSHTYNDALHSLTVMTSGTIPNVGGLIRTLKATVRSRALDQKTPNQNG